VWWTIRDEPSTLAVCEEIGTALIDVALPKVEGIASSESMVAMWQTGLGARANRVRAAQEPDSDCCTCSDARPKLADAIQALEDAARDRTWEASAKLLAALFRAEIK